MSETDPSPLPVLLLMVKDEEDGIVRPIRSAAALGIDTVLLVDTGSTDSTLLVAEGLAEELRITVVCETLAWPGSFADARNTCLQRALARFPLRQALFLDADDAVAGELVLSHAQAHTVQMRMGTDSWPMPRVIRLVTPLPRYHGVVHELLDRSGPPSGLTVVHHAGKSSAERWKRDEALLRADYRATRSPRSLFYLAQTLECLAGVCENDHQEAARLYRLRARDLTTEEGFMAMVRACALGERFPAGERDTPMAVLSDRLRAHEAFPMRPEPLVDAAWAFLRRGQWASAYAFAKMAQGCTPREDALFLRRTAQWNETYDILSRACLHVPGKLEEGLGITRTAAKHLAPGVAAFDWPRNNLAAYRERLGIAEPFPEEDAAFVGGRPR